MRLVLRIFGQPPAEAWRVALLRRTIAVAALALVAATWPTWTPRLDFPHVPLFRFGVGLPACCDWLGLAGMIVGLLVSLVAPQRVRWSALGLMLFAASTSGMILLDQQRLQPWAYQFVLMVTTLALADGRSALPLLRLLVVSFYFNSALTKFDYSFLHTLGQQFLSSLAGTLGGTLVGWSDEARLAAAALFPAGELLVALGLCFAQGRTAALAGAVALHFLLLAILGPWRLDHKPGVLIWNVYFIAQDVLLFARLGRHASVRALPGDLAQVPPRAPWAVQLMIFAAVLLPLLSPTAWFDMWPSWGLYASSAERVALFVHRRESDRVPEDIRPFVEPSADADDPWLRVRMDRWALAVLGAPIYPQCRSQLGVAEAIIARSAPSGRARVVRFGLADRLTGKRAHDVLASLPQLQAAGDEYYFNTLPRRPSD